MIELQAIVLGIIQGLTEFIPVSSSGHLVFVPKLFGWSDQGLAFDVVVHLGTLLAVVIYFREKLLRIGKSFVTELPENKTYRRLGWLLIFTIIPAGIIGLLGGDWIETQLRSPEVIAYGLIGWGAVLYIADKYSAKLKTHTDTEHMSIKQVVAVACAQAIALIPGTSRSGITMTAGLFAKLDKSSAAEFSFLMSVPVIALAGALKVIELIQTGLGELTLSALVLGFIASAISGFFAISALMNIIKKWSFKPFVIYRIIVGILILVFLV